MSERDERPRSGFGPDGGREQPSGSDAAGSPHGLPPEAARRESEAEREDTDAGDPFAFNARATGEANEASPDTPPQDDGYIERPAGMDPVDAAKTDLLDQIRSQHG